MSNRRKAEISYHHQVEIQKIFNNYIKGELCIDHFSLNIFFGNESIFFSPTPKMAEELCNKNFVSFDSNYRKEIYKKYKIYPWRSVVCTNLDYVINHLKEEKFGMRSGMMIVRKLGEERYAMYSFATKRQNKFEGQFYFLYHCKANYIGEMGDFMYNELLPVINEYTQESKILMPEIQHPERINLEQVLNNDCQKELFNAISNNNQSNFYDPDPGIRNRTILKLINGGKIKM